MNVLINIDSFDIHNVIYSQPTKNKIKANALFYKMLYSNSCFTITSLYVHIPLGYLILKHGYYMGMTKSAMNRFILLEKELLLAFNTSCKKIPVYTKFETHKIYSKHKIKSIQLLLSGIWETDTNIGIVYKYIILYKYPP